MAWVEPGVLRLQKGISAVPRSIGPDVSIVASVDSYGKVDYLEGSARTVQRNCPLSKAKTKEQEVQDEQ